MIQAQTHLLFDKHIATLRKAMAAGESRTQWNPYPENPEQAVNARSKRAARHLMRFGCIVLSRSARHDRMGLGRAISQVG
ncbi:hypothetical protein [Georgfuchsia toluolica]|nr:hypothetical protein [Georgfuchsia toluolica]